MLVFQSLNHVLVFFHHFFLGCFVFLVELEGLLLINSQIFELASDLVSDSNHVLGIEKLVLEELGLLVLRYRSKVATMEATPS